MAISSTGKAISSRQNNAKSPGETTEEVENQPRPELECR